MADQLNMNGLNLNGGGEPRSYIPPHMRGKMGGPAPAGPPPGPNSGPPTMNGGAGGLPGSAWAAPNG
jgi:ATP-dependent RNA helicase DDX3X